MTRRRTVWMWLMATELFAATGCPSIDPDCATLNTAADRGDIIDQGIAGHFGVADDECDPLQCRCSLKDGVMLVVPVEVMPVDDAAAQAAVVGGRVERVVSEGSRWSLATAPGPHLVCGEAGDFCIGVDVAPGEVRTIHLVDPFAIPSAIGLATSAFFMEELLYCVEDDQCGGLGVCLDISCRRDPGCRDDDVETPCESPCPGRCVDPGLLGYCTADDECPPEHHCRTRLPDGVCLADRRVDSDGACVGYCVPGCFEVETPKQDPSTGRCITFPDSCTPPGFPPCE